MMDKEEELDVMEDFYYRLVAEEMASTGDDEAEKAKGKLFKIAETSKDNPWITWLKKVTEYRDINLDDLKPRFEHYFRTVRR